MILVSLAWCPGWSISSLHMCSRRVCDIWLLDNIIGDCSPHSQNKLKPACIKTLMFIVENSGAWIMHQSTDNINIPVICRQHTHQYMNINIDTKKKSISIFYLLYSLISFNGNPYPNLEWILSIQWIQNSNHVRSVREGVMNPYCQTVFPLELVRKLVSWSGDVWCIMALACFVDCF